MKKFYLSALGCLMAVGASAQTFNPVNSVVNGYMLGSINKEFTNTGKGIVYTMEEGDNAVEFKLYDEQFNVTKTLNVNLNANYDRQVTEMREAVVTIEDYSETDYTDRYIQWYESHKDGDVTFDTEDITDFLAYNGDEVDSMSTKGDSMIFIPDYYYEEYYNGKKYPRRYYVSVGAELYSIYLYYQSTYTGGWVTKTEHYSSDNNTLSYYLDLDAGPMIEAPTGYHYATQSLFNNDSKLEFIRRVYEEVPDGGYEQDRDYDGEVDYRQMRYDSRTTRFEIVNEDNEVLTSIDCPTESDYALPVVLKWGDNHYIGLFLSFSGEEYEAEDGGEYAWDIYLIEKSTNSIRKVNSTPLMSVMPTLANRNSTVNVTLDAETAKNGGELIITDSNGRAIGRRRVEVGQTSVPVTTDRMTSGVYNITLTEKGQKVENARIIVK